MTALDRAARDGAQAIRAGYARYRRDFRDLTRRARVRFERCEWREGRFDAAERLVHYRRVLDGVLADLRQCMGELLEDAPTWRALKREFEESIADDGDAELEQTFFNSTTRRVFGTIGVDATIEFVDLDPRRDRYGPAQPVYRRYGGRAELAHLLRRVLIDYQPSLPYRDLEGDVQRVALALQSAWSAACHPAAPEALEMAEPVFYRGTGAYLVGRAVAGSGEGLRARPLIIVLLNGPGGLRVDALLADESEVSIVFSFTRSHFHVEVERPAELVRFLKTIMPRKPLAELYISLGHPKHGKTELYRDLLGHLNRSMDRFEHAPGDAGLVMIVFTLPSHDYVFKVIRDRFAPPKTTTKDRVRARYQLVFEHDRAGRLIEAQEFEFLTFDRWRFTTALLAELLDSAAQNVVAVGDHVTLRHVYVERRVEPLNLFLRRAPPAEAARAAVEYGQALRDLACSNIFPGDLLLKNFGVTRHGRVTFYDYDELCLVTECDFRDLPKPRGEDEEHSAEPWFYVGERDVFPEEFLPFLSLLDGQREAFLAEHAEILTARFWRDLKRRHEAGEVIDIFPYPPARRLVPGPG